MTKILEPISIAKYDGRKSYTHVAYNSNQQTESSFGGAEMFDDCSDGAYMFDDCSDGVYKISS